jgi:predicted GNAT superfamily acetyltransferase
MDHEVSIRALESESDFTECVAIQAETWGCREAVPANTLRLVNRIGGVLLGAFRETELVGFVLSFPDVSGPANAQWSHMLASKMIGVGTALKLRQREVLLARGVSQILWTFDPLESRNAHLNFTLLGAHLGDFVADMYPDSTSERHSHGTDRVVVRWDLYEPVPALQESARVPLLGYQVPIPSDLTNLKTESPELVAVYRKRLASDFRQLLDQGSKFLGFHSSNGERDSYYVWSAAPKRRSDS